MEKYYISNILAKNYTNGYLKTILKVIDCSITDEDIDNATDIYGIFSRNSNRLVAVIMGHKDEFRNDAISITEVVDGIVSSKPLINTFYNVTNFSVVNFDIPDDFYFGMLLSEFFADKNNMNAHYTITGKESTNMYVYLKNIGFEGEPAVGCTLVRFPTNTWH